MADGKHMTRNGLHLRTSSGKLATGCTPGPCNACEWRFNDPITLAVSGFDDQGAQCWWNSYEWVQILGGNINRTITLPSNGPGLCSWQMLVTGTGTFNVYNNSGCTGTPIRTGSLATSLLYKISVVAYDQLYLMWNIYVSVAQYTGILAQSASWDCSQPHVIIPNTRHGGSTGAFGGQAEIWLGM
jgi:hypothetical protein